jgi:hypothetical protein
MLFPQAPTTAKVENGFALPDARTRMPLKRTMGDAARPPANALGGGVTFEMSDVNSDGVVACRVTPLALFDLAEPLHEPLLDTFHRNRELIEKLASERYDGGENPPVVRNFLFGRS